MSKAREAKAKAEAEFVEKASSWAEAKVKEEAEIASLVYKAR